MKFAILGEDRSDADTVTVLVQRLYQEKHKDKKSRPSIAAKGYHGWSDICRKGANRDLGGYLALGCHKFIVCVDADGPDHESRRKTIQHNVINKSGVARNYCVVIPVQEIEAWMLADIEQASNIIAAWSPKPIQNPEAINSPKERLRRLSRLPGTKRARYDEVRDNKRLAAYLRLDVVKKKCPSFGTLSRSS